MQEIPDIMEELFLAWVPGPEPGQWPEYLREDPVRGYGLFSHDLDLFPSYTAGLYEENGSVLFVTRGLGNSGPSFRVFNRPEIAVLTLRRAEG